MTSSCYTLLLFRLHYIEDYEVRLGSLNLYTRSQLQEDTIFGLDFTHFFAYIRSTNFFYLSSFSHTHTPKKFWIFFNWLFNWTLRNCSFFQFTARISKLMNKVDNVSFFFNVLQCFDFTGSLVGWGWLSLDSRNWNVFPETYGNGIF